MAIAEGGVLSGISFSTINGTVMVEDVESRSAAEDGGIIVGDRIVSVDGQDTSLAEEMDSYVEEKLAEGCSVIVEVEGSGKRRLVWIRLPKMSRSDSRFLDVYAHIREHWNNMVSVWDSACSLYYDVASGSEDEDLFRSSVLKDTGEIQRLRTVLIDTTIPSLPGPFWTELSRAKEFMEWTAFAMDEAIQNMALEVGNKNAVRRRMNSVRWGRSAVERHLSLAFRESGVVTERSFF
ncbi:PDZ domain-containing protein [Dethiosulfovibrio sp. F2B]|uniref:PDZ domain-containing protein n=1 Tax=Dethiosulfovibrio faecalis TaxID=2720018 RepID=UPI001F2759AE|nr:PDZ domain-containing protein [Dethiosulfovibrio faecalis]